MLAGMVVSVFLVLATVLVHYEALRLISYILPHLRVPPRSRILVVIIGSFTAHTIEVWLYAVGFYVLDRHAELGHLTGDSADGFFAYIYYSSVTYTSLGFGDLVPHGSLRLISGVEALNGLMLIGWTASFTYLAMEKLWDLHPRRNRRKWD